MVTGNRLMFHHFCWPVVDTALEFEIKAVAGVARTVSENPAMLLWRQSNSIMVDIRLNLYGWDQTIYQIHRIDK